MLVDPHNVTPRATATVDLISKVMRPWLFRVTVTGEPPHAWIRVYPIAAPDDDAAAMKGLELFVAECGRPMPIGVVSAVPKAKLA
jgi:hypothetical protein